MRRLAWCVALALSGCGGPATEQPVAPKKAAAPPPQPADESRRFPSKNQVKIELVPEHLLGKTFLPGGNLAEYKLRGKTYQQFLIRAQTPDKAAFLLDDYKSILADPRFVPHMGAFYGLDAGRPVYVLQKGVWLAGYVGLTDQEAEPLAREFAARLN